MVLYPFLNSFRLAFFEKTLFTKVPKFVGLANIEKVFADPLVLESLVVTLTYVALSTVLTFVIGFAWAIVINEQFRGRFAVRTLTLIPWVLPGIVAAFLFSWIFNGRYGIFNAVLLHLGIIDDPIFWLAGPQTAMWSVIVTKTWLTVPFISLFFLAALQSLPRDQVEAALIDGAGNLQILWNIVVPHMKMTMLVVIVLAAKGSIQHFDTIYTMTGGGPVRSTSTIAIAIYRQAFENWNTGLAAALGLVMFVMIAAPSYLLLRSPK